MGARSSKRIAPAGRGSAQSRRAAREKLVYSFGVNGAEGSADMKDTLGGKGANLAEMAGLGVPVPPGFTITTDVCRYFRENDGRYPAALRAQVEKALERMEAALGRRFGGSEKPLLLSVRSGARASMPGMMDTVLNLGLNQAGVEALAAESGNARFAWDCYRRFVQMFGDVVLGLKAAEGEPDPFEEMLHQHKERRGVELDTELEAEDLRAIAEDFKRLIRERLGVGFPDDAQEQLWAAIGAVFGSWDNARANTYRRLNRIPDSWGTAVNVQAMVFGNLGADCATGVAFTRSPSNGEKGLFGEFLVDAQGEDVVAGIRTPQQITRAASIDRARSAGQEDGERPPSLEEVMPACFRQLARIARDLEKHYRDMQDLEFTIERGKLWMLQTRTGKRTTAAAVKIAVDMVGEKLIDRRTAVLRVAPAHLDQLLHPQIDPATRPEPVGKGLPASPGAVSGEVVFSADQAVRAVEQGRRVILVRTETSPEDIHGMNVAQGILTARGGMTSHAAVVARGMGKCCVSGCSDLHVDFAAQKARIGENTIRAGDWITLDGSNGEIYLGTVATTTPELSGDFGRFMQWADGFRKLRVRANADTPHDAEVARTFGAEGIGLCRTEHMFFDGDRIDAVREMILATDRAGRERALAKLLPMQKRDFLEILRTMHDLPVTIRLLDPPLHEFLPAGDDEITELAEKIGVDARRLAEVRDDLAELNPMLGHRGCRLGISYPEIYQMQVRAIGEATCELRREGIVVHPEIMIPLVGHVRELEILRAEALEVLAVTAAEYGMKLKAPIGTMIELPRAALTADEIATQAEFFSFGTNDLTQTTFGLSRDDSARFLPAYIKRGVLPGDPFVSIDRSGVGQLVAIAVERGRSARADIKLGICGEHGGDPDSVMFCHHIGLTYVSCSPYRVPVARLAAAHAALGVHPAS